MSKTFIKEISELQNAGVIDAETADRIQAHYERKQEAGAGKLVLVLGLLGALLVGSGVILLLAHNWDELNKITKTIVAFLPLALGQSLCIFTLLKKKESALWREASAILLFSGIGACMAIISQVYHINGSLPSFLLTWMLLSLPLVYLMPSSVSALFYLVGISWYACEKGYSFSGSAHPPYLYWGLLLLLAPHYYKYFGKASQQTYFLFLNWFLGLSITICLGSFSVGSGSTSWLAYTSLFSLLILLGKLNALNKRGFFTNPFHSIGTVGSFFVLFSWSFEWMWHGYNKTQGQSIQPGFMLVFSIVSILISIALYFMLRKKSLLSPGWMSCLVFLISAVILKDNYRLGLLLVNGWILYLGIYYIRRGSQENNMPVLNFGLLIILVLAICRFFDNEIPFVWRGLFFLVAGIGFFVANYLMFRKRSSLK
jgi:uncharacterized membrane protein